MFHFFKKCSNHFIMKLFLEAFFLQGTWLPIFRMLLCLVLRQQPGLLISKNFPELKQSLIDWLVVDLPLWKILISWDDILFQYMEIHKSHVPNHQPVEIRIYRLVWANISTSTLRGIVWCLKLGARERRKDELSWKGTRGRPDPQTQKKHVVVS